MAENSSEQNVLDEPPIDPKLLKTAQGIVERTIRTAKLEGTKVKLDPKALARHWQQEKSKK